VYNAKQGNADMKLFTSIFLICVVGYRGLCGRDSRGSAMKIPARIIATVADAVMTAHTSCAHAREGHMGP